MLGRTSRSVWAWSLPVALLATFTSVLGLTDPNIYEQETANWMLQAQGQDIGNLVAVLALLISAHWFARGSHRAGLVWLGTLLYFVYAFIVYSIAVHFNELFLAYVAVLGLSTYAVLFTVNGLRVADEDQGGHRARRLAGGTALAIGVLFALLWLSELVPATMTGEAPQSVADAGLWVNPIHVIDLAALLPALVVAGVMTLKGRPAGEFFVGPLLVFSVLMGTSIVAAMVLMTTEGFDDTVAPMVMVSVVVLASLIAAWRYLGSYGAAR